MSHLLLTDPVKPIEEDRPTRLLARVDVKLATLASDAERRVFLDVMLVAWERRYARFICTEGASEAPMIEADDPPHATDFLLTIAGLSARRSALPC